MLFVVCNNSPAHGARRKTINEEVEEDEALLEQWALCSESRYFVFLVAPLVVCTRW